MQVSNRPETWVVKQAQISFMQLSLNTVRDIVKQACHSRFRKTFNRNFDSVTKGTKANVMDRTFSAAHLDN